MERPEALYLLYAKYFDTVYPAAVREEARRWAQVTDRCLPLEDLEAREADTSQTRVVLSGWGMPVADEAFMARFPRLELICYAGGSIRAFATDAMWEQGVRVTHAASQNAQPVAEFAFAHIVLACKRALPVMRESRRRRMFCRDTRVTGAYGVRVGVVSLGQIGRLVVERLRSLGVETVVYDVLEDPAWARRAGVRYASLEEVFATCSVVSLHTPLLPQTIGLINEPLLNSMAPRSTLINTARGGIVDQPALVEMLRRRPDVTAILDVTCPEPPPDDSPLWQLDNAFVFPHLAGAMGSEHQRLGQAMVDELRRYVHRQPLTFEVTRESALAMA